VAVEVFQAHDRFLQEQLPAACLGHSDSAGRATSSSSRIVVEFDRGVSGVLGLEIDSTEPEVCLIKAVLLHGLVASWNTSCGSDKEAVKPMDRIVSVNGETGLVGDLLALMAQSQVIRLVLERPKAKNLIIQKNGLQLGLKLELNDKSVGLAIKGVFGGIAAGMNLSMELDQQLK
ncbi:unnamed protein product, partial [Polarella glacialis]